jgi:hypothetical protein
VFAKSFPTFTPRCLARIFASSAPEYPDAPMTDAVIMPVSIALPSLDLVDVQI